jgi:hypothetical protein
LGDEWGQDRCIHSPGECDDFHFWVDRIQRLLCSLDLHRPDRLGAVEDLALQVGEVDLVAVGEGQASDAGRGQVECRGAAEAARADEERACRAQLLLALNSELGKEDMPAVAEKLLVLQFVLV